MKKQRNFWYFIGVLVGIACVIGGVYFISELPNIVEEYSTSNSSTAIYFGADYYTESYRAMARTGNNVAVLAKILYLLYDLICYGVGAILIASGAITTVSFASKIALNNKNTQKEEILNTQKE